MAPIIHRCGGHSVATVVHGRALRGTVGGSQPTLWRCREPVTMKRVPAVQPNARSFARRLRPRAARRPRHPMLPPTKRPIRLAAVAAPASAPAALIKRHERWAWGLLALLLALVAGWPAWVRYEPPGPQHRRRTTSTRCASRSRRSRCRRPRAKAYEAVIGSVVRVVGRGRARTPAEPTQQGKRRPHTQRRHRRGDRRQRHHPDQPARGARREAHQGHLRRRHRIRRHADRRAAGERPGGAARHRIPDDLEAATMRSTGDLRPATR